MGSAADELRQRLEQALAPQKPPTIEEVLAEIGRRGVLSGSLDRVFVGYKMYITYVTDILRKIYPNEEKYLSLFAEYQSKILEDAFSQAHEGLRVARDGASEILKASTFEGKKTFYLPLRVSSLTAYFPDLLKMGEVAELFQLGWRASDEGDAEGRPYIHTAQPWQLYAWLATRPGHVQLSIYRINLTNRGISPLFAAVSKSWRQKWSKEDAIMKVLVYYKKGEVRPLLTWWLGDGSVEWSFVDKRHYKLRLTVKDEYKRLIVAQLGAYSERRERYVYIPGGKRLFKALIDAAGPYGKLLDALQAHKWLYLKSIDRPRRRGKKAFSGPRIDNVVKIGDIVMKLRVVFNEGGSLYAERYVKTYQEAINLANKLKELGISPKIYKKATSYGVYISTKELKKLTEKDEMLKNRVKEFLENKSKNLPEKHNRVIQKLRKRLAI